MEREVGGGIGMGNTCKPMAVSFQCMTKFTINKKKKVNTLFKINSERPKQIVAALYTNSLTVRELLTIFGAIRSRKTEK